MDVSLRKSRPPVMEAWAVKWDVEIRRVVANKYNTAHVAKGTASRDYARRIRHKRQAQELTWAMEASAW